MRRGGEGEKKKKMKKKNVVFEARAYELMPVWRSRVRDGWRGRSGAISIAAAMLG